MTLSDVLASAGAVTKQAAEGARPMVGVRYPIDLIWAVVVRAKNDIEGAEIYPGRDPNGNQIAFVSNRPPGQNTPAGAAPAEQVTLFRQGAATFNGVAVIDASTLTDGELAAGKLLAHNAGMAKLSDADIKVLMKTIEAEDKANEPEAS